MPRLIHRTPKYRKHASGQAVVTLAGRDVYLGVHGSKASRDEYNRLIGEWLVNDRQRAPRPRCQLQAGSEAGADLTIVELIDAYLTYCQTYYGTGHAGELRNQIGMMKLVKRLYARTRAADFGPLALKAVREEMVKAKWTRTHINAQVGRVRRMFKWAAGNELVPAAVADALRFVDGLRVGRTEAREADPVTPVADALVDATLVHCGPQVKAMIRLQRMTGMRPGEVVIMRGADLTTGGELWEYRPASHKNAHRGHARVIILSKAARAIIEPMLKPNPLAYIFSPAEGEAVRRAKYRRAKSTRRQPGERYGVDSYRQAIIRAADKAFPLPDHLHRQRGETPAAWKARLVEAKLWPEVEAWRSAHRWHPHQLRHTAATEFRKRFGLDVAQVLLGHKTLDVTQVYAERDVAKARQVMGELA